MQGGEAVKRQSVLGPKVRVYKADGRRTSYALPRDFYLLESLELE